MMVFAMPLPLMVSVRYWQRPAAPARVMVPVGAGLEVMTLSMPSLFALRMAWRNEPAPLSLVFVTTRLL
jgi:hypothetical protein